jgi:hypothetical protein
MNKRERKIRRILHRTRTKLLGGRAKADQLRRQAANLRIQHDLCRCGDDERYYPSHEAADSDLSPAAVCGECGKKKLLHKIVCQGDNPPSGRDLMIATARLLK